MLAFLRLSPSQRHRVVDWLDNHIDDNTDDHTDDQTDDHHNDDHYNDDHHNDDHHNDDHHSDDHHSDDGHSWPNWPDFPSSCHFAFKIRCVISFFRLDVSQRHDLLDFFERHINDAVMDNGGWGGGNYMNGNGW